MVIETGCNETGFKTLLTVNAIVDPAATELANPLVITRVLVDWVNVHVREDEMVVTAAHTDVPLVVTIY